MTESFDFSAAPPSSSDDGRRPASSRHLFQDSFTPEKEAPAYDGPIDYPAFLDSLNPPQREAVLATDGPLIVLAGAGSGKTKMLTSRIAFLIQAKRVPGHRILAVTFTNKAAAEMRERVEKSLNLAAGALTPRYGGSYLGVPEIGTFHSVCIRILRREMAKTPYTGQFVIYDDSDQLSLIKSCLEKLNIDDKVVNPKAVQGTINRLKCDAVEPHEMEPSPHNVFEKQAQRVYEQYQKDLYANNAIDFGEILTLTYRLFRDHADVRAKYQARYRYLHVDEYQDTNRAQYRLLSQLADPKFGGHGNICVVGDEDQSIYKWRGADINNILDFEHDYPGAKIVKLEQNYRSTQTIIEAAGHVIRNNRQRKDKTLWTENQAGTQIIRAQLADERAEAEMVGSEIRRLAEHEGRNYGDFAIFYRTNAQSRQLEDVLRREKVPYQIIGGLRFYDRKEIKDVMAYFKLILNPADSVSLKRVINVPPRGIGKTTLDRLEAHYINESRAAANAGRAFTYWNALEAAASDAAITSAATAKKLAPFVALVRKLVADQPQLLLSELYHLILDETGYVRELRREGTEEAMARIENLEEFDNLLKEFEEDIFEDLENPEAGVAVDGGASPAQVTESLKADARARLLVQFIEQSSLASDADSAGAYAGSVKMMTLHSSKGLEFPVVFLVGLEEGLFPSVRQWEEASDEDIEEERRLCYVGMTRAREQLYMMNVIVRRQWGNINYQEPSRFFNEVPASLVDFRDLARGPGSMQFRTGSSRGFASFGEGRSSAYEEPSISRSAAYSPPAPASAASPFRSPIPVSDAVGRQMSHPEYGPGTVIGAEGSGPDQKVTVEFRGRQQRKFLYRYVAGFFI